MRRLGGSSFSARSGYRTPFGPTLASFQRGFLIWRAGRSGVPPFRARLSTMEGTAAVVRFLRRRTCAGSDSSRRRSVPCRREVDRQARVSLNVDSVEDILRMLGKRLHLSVGFVAAGNTSPPQCGAVGEFFEDVIFAAHCGPHVQDNM